MTIHYLPRTTEVSQLPMFCPYRTKRFGWIVFRRQADKLTFDCNDIPDIEDDITDDEDFFSAEADDPMMVNTTDDELAIPADDPQYNTCEYDRMQDAAESDKTSADLSAGYNATADPQVSEFCT